VQVGDWDFDEYAFKNQRKNTNTVKAPMDYTLGISEKGILFLDRHSKVCDHCSLTPNADSLLLVVVATLFPAAGAEASRQALQDPAQRLQQRVLLVPHRRPQ
jgi:hypothetical protein